jgi:haloalkane dehalogenase
MPPQSASAGHANATHIDRVAYPFTNHWIDLPAGRMHYVDEGVGEALLFIHGTPTWSFEWRHLIRALVPQYRCIAPDMIGFGLSDRPRDFPYTPEAHAEQLAAFVDALDLGPFTLIVHDYGGPIGLPLALRQPQRVTRLALINTWMWSFAEDRAMAQKGRIAGSSLGRFLYRWANLSLRVIMPSAYGDRRKLTPTIQRQYLERFPDRWSRGAVLWPLARAILGSSSYYDSLWQQREQLRGRPALIIWGMHDTAFEPYQLARWREILPEAQVVELAEAGHWPHEEAPEQVNATLRDFLLHTPHNLA